MTGIFFGAFPRSLYFIDRPGIFELQILKGLLMDATETPENDLLSLAADTIRCLAMDAVQKANSGHPGMPMGCADMAVTLWLKFLRHNPADPIWPGRDRFVLSAGHGSMLLYSLLHLAGYDLPMNQVMNFRQWESITPGHPEYGHTPGVETTTGPLGQGFSNGIGMALAERHLAEIFNRPDFPIVNHYTYGIVSDGDLMEGLSAEAASLAGHLGLGKVIYLYDDNQITIEGETDLAFSRENVEQRFRAYSWHTVSVDGHNMQEVAEAIEEAQKETERPSLILTRTHIAHKSPGKHDTAGSHGAPLGEEEVLATKKAIGFPEDQPFYIPEKVTSLFSERTEELKKIASEWQDMFDKYREKYPELYEKWKTCHSVPDKGTLEKISVDFELGKPVATRGASGDALQELAEEIPNLVGGSADLAPSNKTMLKGKGEMSAGSFSGRNIHFGVREHAMAGILNGMALHGGVIPFGGTFLVFSDYMRPAIRLACMMRLPLVYVFTHDSIFVGEDGPTHQPVEQLMALRLIPGLTVIRPSDATETVEAWKTALTSGEPTALILTRHKIPVFDRNKLAPAGNLSRGAYIIKETDGKPDCLLLASGSEVITALKASENLGGKGIKVRVVSFPSWELFEKQTEEYKKEILPDDVTKRLVVEAGRGVGWEKYIGAAGELHTIDRFGASAPYQVLAEKYGMTPEAVVEHVENMLSE